MWIKEETGPNVFTLPSWSFPPAQAVTPSGLLRGNSQSVKRQHREGSCGSIDRWLLVRPGK
jgi:hypothetical protein